MNTADAMLAAGHRVVVWSSAFYHQERRHRTRTSQRRAVRPSLEYRLIPSPGYRRSVGPGRLVDHALLAMRLRRELRDEARPAACLIGYPPIETAAVMVRWCTARRVPCLIDVKDQWPELFLEAIPGHLRAPARMLLTPYYRLARRAMRDATGLVGMSKSYVRWAVDFADRALGEHDLVVPLTSPRPPIDEEAQRGARAWWDARGVHHDGRPRFCFVGSHTRSFDFGPVAEAAKALAVSRPSVELVICGAGEESERWRVAAAGAPNVRFAGWIDRPRMEVLSQRCSGFIAPYVRSPGFDMNIPNKIVDALALGLPIVTSLDGEVAAMIDEHDVGCRYGGTAGRSLRQCLETLADDEERRRRQSTAARALYEARFTYEEVYGSLVAHLERLASTDGVR